MSVLRQLVAFLVTVSLAFPAWGGSGTAGSNVVGNAVRSHLASLQTGSLESGSTLFNGDTISVRQDGYAQIALLGGGRLDVLDNGLVRLARQADAVEVVPERGTVLFHSAPGAPVQARLADATIRAAAGAPAAAAIGFETPDTALVTARRGTLELFSAHDGNTLLLPEGSAARISLVPEEQGGAQPAGRAAPRGPSNRRLAIIALLVGAGLTTTALILATRHEPDFVSPNFPD